METVFLSSKAVLQSSEILNEAEQVDCLKKKR